MFVCLWIFFHIVVLFIVLHINGELVYGTDGTQQTKKHSCLIYE